MMPDREALPIGRRIALPGHFDVPVVLENARPLGADGSAGYECRVRLPDGRLDEAVISVAEAQALVETNVGPATQLRPVDAERLRLLIESARIRLAYAHDRQFAVSLSGIRTLPHQIEAVYQRMLPQPRLRFLLADDPGAGKTIMAGLLIKELKLREAVERVLILCPAPLTIQWQDEMLRWFGEPFEMIFAAVDQQQLVNPWQRATQVVASIDYAKQDDVRERIWQQPWDLVIIDEAHKCSAYTRSQSGRNDEVSETKRYQLAKKLTSLADHVVLLTATPHHGDEDRFAHFVRLLDPDLFPEPHRLGQQATEIR
jgi:SNF2 family DNA or RNA helicase